jgi:hypothetical protein
VARSCITDLERGMLEQRKNLGHRLIQTSGENLGLPHPFHQTGLSNHCGCAWAL